MGGRFGRIWADGEGMVIFIHEFYEWARIGEGRKGEGNNWHGSHGFTRILCFGVGFLCEGWIFVWGVGGVDRKIYIPLLSYVNMAIDDRIGKREIFESVVGQEPFRGSHPGDVPEFEISPEKVDKIYLEAKKMERVYSSADNPYYATCFAEIERAYLDSDPEAFRVAVRGLMISIDAD